MGRYSNVSGIAALYPDLEIQLFLVCSHLVGYFALRLFLLSVKSSLFAQQKMLLAGSVNFQEDFNNKSKTSIQLSADIRNGCIKLRILKISWRLTRKSHRKHMDWSETIQL
jgi:hypothetical protein